MMKQILRAVLLVLLVLGVSSCLFKDPIFTTGFAKIDPAIAGVWMAEDENGDPREREFAVLAPIGADALMLHYPAGEKGGFYFEARPLKIRDRDVWQLRQIATFQDGIPAADALTHTVMWVEQAGEGKLSVRPVSMEGAHTSGPDALKKALEDATSDWNKLFGESKTFTRLPDK